ncbi:hypothetical protein EG68_07035 [Paragonimus skrjabini miyazakii]|uniref:Uncharacterized protein n=1 Tax=Paragonimus skrjabini miyazakii TaxID=59628 RepID=A0A8S9YL09_9TREM|nr:hypothetical protein EG68_07035 [Paragonimus skrjabini miyazakii]
MGSKSIDNESEASSCCVSTPNAGTTLRSVAHASATNRPISNATPSARKQIPRDPSSDHTGAHGIERNIRTSRLLPFDLNESDEAGTPEIPRSPYNDEHHSRTGDHRLTLAQPRAPHDIAPVDTSTQLLAEAQRLLSSTTNRDAASSHLLAIVNSQLNEPTCMGSFQAALEEFCQT